MPPKELLEDTHSFPCKFMFKIIGRADGGFLARVAAAAREVLELEADPEFTFREDKGGKHVAITMEPMVANAEQVLAMFARFSKIEGLVMLM